MVIPSYKKLEGKLNDFLEKGNIDELRDFVESFLEVKLSIIDKLKNLENANKLIEISKST
jgi:hypothetical protein